jgi:hypothetical protein
MKQLFFLLSALLFLTGCPPDLEVAPAFILVEDFNFTVAGNGPETTDITEVWAFFDDDNSFIGAFPLPARIPINALGSQNIRLEAGVRQNGISATPDIYEFYTPVTRTLDLVPGEAIDLGVLPITYRSDVKTAVFEDFEIGTNRAFTDVVIGEATFTRVEDVVRSGNFSGRLQLNEDEPLIELATFQQLQGLIDVRPYVWLELDFRSEAPVVWGVTGNRGIENVRVFDPGFSPRNEWTKIYFNLSEVIVLANLDEFQLILSALLPPNVTEAEVYLDNIKLLYF